MRSLPYALPYTPPPRITRILDTKHMYRAQGRILGRNWDKSLFFLAIHTLTSTNNGFYSPPGTEVV